ncbi:hypothetical protein A1O1_08138 [Capronia coronata CBS 617.96]|uniref:SPX domain-containing protein n=1 Tax=Capronia coronata CBS 617.96 TaxID=1182541 RepID=W9YIE4_9EURO|nr:uncharacterized protein A1O1_08138 [Capronia coronata CBS 617.96]EXJ82069.1 hypothetical protein A1O1_08138 [Capronia coronata CBS 617.96]
MKFGQTLVQRSVPKWAPYNVNYNELKNLIKERTSAGVAVPVDIPAQGKSRWEELDNLLFNYLSAEYDNVTLFLRSKQGEIERRLAHVEKQIGIARRAVQDNALDKPILQARKYRQLAKDIEEIGDEIQNLARYAAVQRTAFRKILKKYRKWTGSTSLQTRLDVEVFSSNKLRTDFSDYLQQLAEVKTILTDELAGPMLTGRRRETSLGQQQKRVSASTKRSPIAQINEALLRGPLAFDAAISTVPYGEAAGSAFYWIHPDNLDEARMLLLRHMRDPAGSATHPRRNSAESEEARKRVTSFSDANSALSHMVLFDNSQRFIRDTSVSRPSRIALSAHWSRDPEAVVTLAGLSPTSSAGTILTVSRKALGKALDRDSLASDASNEVRAIHHYLSEHRDVKPLAEVCMKRSRYIGMNNTNEVANWATLDTAVTVAPVQATEIGEPQHQSPAGDAFPYAILHIRWEFARTPTVVRAFDESHLVERVHDFSLEDMAIHSAQKDLPPPSWHSVLEKDIRKVPLVPRLSRFGASSRSRLNASDAVGLSSGPSSTEGRPDSVFSAPMGGQSSVTSDDGGVIGTPATASKPTPETTKARRKKRARIQVPERESRPSRYWNEFDDGDSDGNPSDEYVIYVDPDEPVFPGAETVSKAFGAMYDSFSRGTGKLISWLPLASTRVGHTADGERAPLLADQLNSEGDPDSSSSDTDGFTVPPQHQPHKSRRRKDGPKRQSSSGYRPHQLLSPRQRALERTLFYFYSGLLALAYVLLVMSSILLGTGRRKAMVEVDAGVLAGVIFAEMCAITAVILIFMRKQRLSVLHWGLVGVMVASVVVIGVALLALMFANIKGATERKGHSKLASG